MGKNVKNGPATHLKSLKCVELQHENFNINSHIQVVCKLEQPPELITEVGMNVIGEITPPGNFIGGKMLAGKSEPNGSIPLIHHVQLKHQLDKIELSLKIYNKKKCQPRQ